LIRRINIKHPIFLYAFKGECEGLTEIEHVTFSGNEVIRVVSNWCQSAEPGALPCDKKAQHHWTVQYAASEETAREFPEHIRNFLPKKFAGNPQYF
jgi:hypothetical protein